jgi:hypothetical protein
MLKLNYPVFNLGHYPTTWYEGTMLFGKGARRIYGVIDDKSIEGDFEERRLRLFEQTELPLADIGKPMYNEMDIILHLKSCSKIIDNSGKVYKIRKAKSRWILSFHISDVVYVEGNFLIKFDGTTSRILQEQPPTEKAKFGLFLQTEDSGELFVGFSPYNLEEKIRV